MATTAPWHHLARSSAKYRSMAECSRHGQLCTTSNSGFSFQPSLHRQAIRIGALQAAQRPIIDRGAQRRLPDSASKLHVPSPPPPTARRLSASSSPARARPPFLSFTSPRGSRSLVIPTLKTTEVRYPHLTPVILFGPGQRFVDCLHPPARTYTTHFGFAVHSLDPFPPIARSHTHHTTHPAITTESRPYAANL